MSLLLRMELNCYCGLFADVKNSADVIAVNFIHM